MMWCTAATSAEARQEAAMLLFVLDQVGGGRTKLGRAPGLPMADAVVQALSTTVMQLPPCGAATTVVAGAESTCIELATLLEVLLQATSEPAPEATCTRASALLVRGLMPHICTLLRREAARLAAADRLGFATGGLLDQPCIPGTLFAKLTDILCKLLCATPHSNGDGNAAAAAAARVRTRVEARAGLPVKVGAVPAHARVASRDEEAVRHLALHQLQRTQRSCLLESVLLVRFLVFNRSHATDAASKQLWELLRHGAVPAAARLPGAVHATAAAAVAAAATITTTTATAAATTTSNAMPGSTAISPPQQDANDRAFMRSCLGLIRRLLHGKSNSDAVGELRHVSPVACVLFLLQEMQRVVRPPKQRPAFKMRLRRAATQDEFFRGNLRQSLVQLSEVPTATAEGAGADGAGPGGVDEGDSDVEQGGGGAEATIRDLRAFIAAGLDMNDATELLELLCGGKILDLDLPLSEAHAHVWVPLAEAAASRRRDERERGQRSERRDGGRSFASLAGRQRKTRLGDAAAGAPPMEITYRLAGVDGEATEERVALKDVRPAQSSKSRVKELSVPQQALMRQLAPELPGTTAAPDAAGGHGGQDCARQSGAQSQQDCGLALLLQLVRRGGSACVARAASSPRPLIGARTDETAVASLALWLLRRAAHLPSNRVWLLRFRAPGLLVQRLLQSLTRGSDGGDGGGGSDGGGDDRSNDIAPESTLRAAHASGDALDISGRDTSHWLEIVELVAHEPGAGAGEAEGEGGGGGEGGGAAAAAEAEAGAGAGADTELRNS
eukprot:g685.t1